MVAIGFAMKSVPLGTKTFPFVMVLFAFVWKPFHTHVKDDSRERKDVHRAPDFS
jgi:hypothetical protein